MRRPLFLSLALLLTICFLACPAAEAVWIWTPETGKWINPKFAVKDTPEEQFDYAQRFFEEKNYARAAIEFRKLLKNYEASPQAPEAQYYLGRAREEQRNYHDAFEAYRLVVQKYPSSTRYEEVIEREYNIANYYLRGEKQAILGAKIFPATDVAVEIFTAITEDAPFSKYGDLAQFKKGEAHRALGQYEEAAKAFGDLVERYPRSPLMDDARYQMALCAKQGTFDPAYDQSATDRAIQEFEKFTTTEPPAALQQEINDNLTVLKDKRAQHEWQVAQFYERQRAWESALMYYYGIMKQYPNTSTASRAAERVRVLEQKIGLAAP